MSLSPELAERLEIGLRALGQSSTPEQRHALLAFLELLRKWGETYNLTAVRDASSALDLHLLDSLTVNPYLRGDSVLDVGTGGGLPGIPLAILNPRRQFVLLDSSAKKMRFVRQAAITLELMNVETVANRVEQYRPATGFDIVLARAFASLVAIRDMTARFLNPDGRILALKGRFPRAEIEQLGSDDPRVYRLAIPGRLAERHLIELNLEKAVGQESTG